MEKDKLRGRWESGRRSELSFTSGTVDLEKVGDNRFIVLRWSPFISQLLAPFP